MHGQTAPEFVCVAFYFSLTHGASAANDIRLDLSGQMVRQTDYVSVCDESRDRLLWMIKYFIYWAVPAIKIEIDLMAGGVLNC